MINIFKYIDYAMKAKQGYEAPDELLAETSFAFIENFFILSFVILGLLGVGSLYLGFGLGYLFFKIFGIILVLVLIADILLFRFLKKIVNRISKKITDTVGNRIKNYRTIDVEATEVNHGK